MPPDPQRRSGPLRKPDLQSRSACETNDEDQYSEVSTGVDVCEICDYAEAEGWWGPGHRGTHCRFCHRGRPGAWWTGRAEAHCVARLEDGSRCCLHFSRDSVAEKHRVDGRCLSLSAVVALRRPTGEPVFDLQTRKSAESGDALVRRKDRRRSACLVVVQVFY